MTRLNQIIAVEQGVKSDTDSTRTALLGELGNEGRLSGLTRTYRGRVSEQDGGQVYAGERTKVQVTAEDVLSRLQKSLTRLFDVVLTKDSANASAKANISVNGRVIASDVPVTYFLFLERELGRLREFAEKLPVLDPAKDWTDQGAPPGQWKTETVTTDKTKKTPRNHIKFAGDQWHEPQIETYAEDVVEGWWDWVYFSGAVPARQKQGYLDRIGELQAAVKYAREEANSAQITDRHIASDLLGYIFGRQASTGV